MQEEALSRRQRRGRAKRTRRARKQARRGRIAAGTGLSLAATLAGPPAAEAVDFTVNTTADPGDGTCDGTCALRDAILNSSANNNSPVVDRVLFQSGLSGTVTLGTALPTIDEPLQVLGPGANVLTVSGGNARRSFAPVVPVVGDDVLISGLTLTAGNSGASNGGAIVSMGAELILESMNITGNTSSEEGGGLSQIGGTIVVRDSTISGNDAVGATSLGGGLYTDTITTTVERSTISGNGAERGGGMYPVAFTTIRDSTISNNTAHFGGGIYEDLTSPGGPNLTNTIVADNGVAGTGAAGPDLLNIFNASFTLVEQTSGANVTETVAGSNITDDVSNGMNDVDPGLLALGPNGGPTPTQALPMTSLAVDKGSSIAVTDQRGQPRPSDFAGIPNSMAMGADGADMGAFELQVPPVVPVTPVVPATPASPAQQAPRKKKCKKKRTAAASPRVQKRR